MVFIMLETAGYYKFENILTWNLLPYYLKW